MDGTFDRLTQDVAKVAKLLEDLHKNHECDGGHFVQLFRLFKFSVCKQKQVPKRAIHSKVSGNCMIFADRWRESAIYNVLAWSQIEHSMGINFCEYRTFAKIAKVFVLETFRL